MTSNADLPHAEAFGRARDDRAPLTFAAVGAVIVHVLVAFIELPDRPAPEPPPKPYTRPPIYDWQPPPPDLPEPPADVPPTPIPEPTRLLPLPEIQDLEPIVEPDPVRVDPIDTFEDLPGIDLGEIVPPPAPSLPSVVDESTEGLVPPTPLDQPEPAFPEMAIRARRSGQAILRAVVETDGSVTEIEVVDVTRPDLGFSREAVAAVSRWRYRPGELRGRPIAVRLTVVVDFTLH